MNASQGGEKNLPVSGTDRRVVGRATAIGAAFAFVTHASAAQAPPLSPGPPVTKENDSVPHPLEATPTNRLIRATSPYLLQHAHNPVDWYEWSDEALARAKSEDMPIFLSIGYAACHWCHVMEHESFESADVARLLNENFVSIKVDREERPDLDELYMAYTQALTGGGGWPMSVFLTPDAVPFHAGTYFPKEHFIGLLGQIAAAWSENREQITGSAEKSRAFFESWSAGPKPAEGVISRDAIDQTAALLARYFDRTHGGIASGSNKFPPSQAMDLFLRVYRRTGNQDLFEAVDITLDHMARGGIYDHVGGGICRYSTDPQWLVPHFEKMLYDQAMVSMIYLDAYLVTRNPIYASVARDILNYVIADFRAPKSGFFSSRDADSEGLEGKFYLWTVPQVREVLDDSDADLYCKYFDVTANGNWFERLGHAPPGPKNILHIPKPVDAFARLHGLDPGDFRWRVNQWRGKMKSARDRRVPPALDDKILVDWNGLMIAALAKGGAVLDDPNYTRAAADAADFILQNMQRDGRLLRSHRKGESRLTANLSDYAFLVEGLLNLYEADFNPRRLDEARRLTDLCIQFHEDKVAGGFFFTPSDGEKLLARSKHPRDGAVPSGNSVMAMNLLRLAVLFDRKDYREKAEALFRAFAPMVENSPGAFERLHCAVDFYHDKVKEIAVIGDSDSADTKDLLRTVFDRYLPNRVVVFAPDKAVETPISLLRGKGRIDGKSTAYVCENYRCQQPVTQPHELASLLDGKSN